MKHFILFAFLCIILMFFYSGNAFSQYAVFSNSSSPYVDILGDSCAGTGSERHDSGFFTSANGWGPQVTDGRIVLKFTPSSYPWKYNKICIALTSLMAMADSLQFDIVIYDTTGIGGIPGTTPVFTLANQIARPILSLPEFSWFSFDISSSPQLNSGSYFIGIKYDASQTSQGDKYILSDSDTSLSIWPGYGWSSLIGQWTEAQNIWPGYKCFGMRTLGSSPTGMTNINTTIPEKYNLKQNYPNPFNPITQIEFGIPKKEFVKITVFDITGRVIEKLVNQELNAGTYKVEFNADSYSSGMYFYKLETDGYSDTRKMVLIK